MLWRGFSADSNAFGPARPSRCKFAHLTWTKVEPSSYTMVAKSQPLALHSMAATEAKGPICRGATSCFAASVALLAPGLARQWSESESHPSEPQALTQFLVLSHIVALLSSG